MLAEADPDGRDLNLGAVVDALYPGDAGGVERFRQLRQAMRALAGEHGIEISCEAAGRSARDRRTDLGRLAPPFALRGRPCDQSGAGAEQFVAPLHEHSAHRVARPTELSPQWDCLLPADEARDVIQARATQAMLEHAPRTPRAPGEAIDVQRHLRAWADDSASRPYLVRVGEYGMG